jgi:eukaryotic-like serine/threonine-protein kinase
MGEIYRATDTRLGRDVTVKILPAAFADDPQRRARFEREARAVAALNHPNICTIHDVGRDQGIDFLVMELVDGESLATRLVRGPLPLDQALARAIEIADALDTAHRQGIHEGGIGHVTGRTRQAGR